LRNYPQLVFSLNVGEIKRQTGINVSVHALEDLKAKITKETVTRILLENAGQRQLLNNLRLGSNERSSNAFTQNIANSPTPHPTTAFNQLHSIVQQSASASLPNPVPPAMLCLNINTPLQSRIVSTSLVVSNSTTDMAPAHPPIRISNREKQRTYRIREQQSMTDEQKEQRKKDNAKRKQESRRKNAEAKKQKN
jgi:hypothetical protein